MNVCASPRAGGRRLRRVFQARGRQFSEDARGAVAVLVALAAVPLIGTIGIGVDSARGYIAQSRLSAAVDAAALAGGNNFFGSTRDDDIRMIFHANFPDGYLGASVDGPHIVPDAINQKVTVSASATIPVSLMRLFGNDFMTVVASAEVTRKMKALDVVLSMDMSGSMGTKDSGQTITRLAASQQAAKELIDILFGGETSKDLLNIGLVPWSSKVNVMIEGQAFNAGLNKTVAVPSFTAPDINRVQSNIYYANNWPGRCWSRRPRVGRGASLIATSMTGPMTTTATSAMVRSPAAVRTGRLGRRYYRATIVNLELRRAWISLLSGCQSR